MSDSADPAELQKHVKKYLLIGGILLAATAATIAIAFYEFPTHSMNIIVGMIVATIKASLVALIFMHLNHERPLIYKFLAFTTVFCVVLFVLFIFSNADPLVDHGFDAPLEAVEK
ncbi:MAG: cytochrome C oxidase subunit IV family protein [Verrucomicrobiaceae bacterium]|jgi:caa(3)-type oxidase subunit IV|nr:cytochrome C oxidase subunit IV family protein [Verrucomicrobiaceae bacterium]